MTAYLLRRLAYAVPILLGVNLLTFMLFFVVNPPQDQARRGLDDKRAGPDNIRTYLQVRGYDKPRFYNPKAESGHRFTDTIFYQKYVPMLWLDFGASDGGDRHQIGREIRVRMIPSLAVTVPVLLLGLFLDLFISMMVAYYRGTYIDVMSVVLCVVAMSISTLYYIIGLQFIIGKELRLIPISGWSQGLDLWRFAIGPVIIAIVSGIGGSVRFYRTIFLEELGKDYIRTARSKGLPEHRVLFGHGLRNAMIPMLTGVVAELPFLIIGGLLLENFFAIPGLGNYSVSAIQAKDFAVVRSMVYLGSILFIVGLILTDISYAMADPRISFTGGESRNRMWTVYLGVLVFTAAVFLAGHYTDPMRNGFTAFTVDLKYESIIAQKALKAPGGAEAAAAAEARWNTVKVWFANAATAAVALLAIASVIVASRRAYWRSAWRQVRSRGIAMACFAVLIFAALIALLDSIAWRDPVLDAEGNPKINQTTDKPDLKPTADSLLDRAWVSAWRAAYPATPKPIRIVTDTGETTYSAPLADAGFQKSVDEESGERIFKPLDYPRSHVLGTDINGADTLFKCLKGVRTGLIIGLLTTLIALPFAMLFGILAGYVGKWVDDIVQYIYTTLASIPGILLIMAFILIFGQSLFFLCIILGVTGWVGLCRLLRGESLKLREADYVQAARALGVGEIRIMWRHLVPNLMHIVLINTVLAFSGLVMAEAVLAYIGVGVGSQSESWGNMINMARLELTRDPIIWWSIAGSFVFMFVLILAANLFSDAVRDALDPRLRTR
jgi:ABC-type dipeptide/oligopeptide/nickel transport system permease component